MGVFVRTLMYARKEMFELTCHHQVQKKILLSPLIATWNRMDFEPLAMCNSPKGEKNESIKGEELHWLECPNGLPYLTAFCWHFFILLHNFWVFHFLLTFVFSTQGKTMPTQGYVSFTFYSRYVFFVLVFFTTFYNSFSANITRILFCRLGLWPSTSFQLSLSITLS